MSHINFLYKKTTGEFVTHQKKLNSLLFSTGNRTTNGAEKSYRGVIVVFTAIRRLKSFRGADTAICYRQHLGAPGKTQRVSTEGKGVDHGLVHIVVLPVPLRMMIEVRIAPLFQHPVEKQQLHPVEPHLLFLEARKDIPDGIPVDHPVHKELLFFLHRIPGPKSHPVRIGENLDALSKEALFIINRLSCPRGAFFTHRHLTEGCLSL